MLIQDVAIEGTAYFPFAVNDTSGSADDGASPLFDVRLNGAAAGAAPVLSGTPTGPLSDAGFGDGLYEVPVAATAGNGFAPGNTYTVYVTITADGQTPAGVAGMLKVVAAADTLHDAAARLMDISTATEISADLEKILGSAVTGTPAQIVAAFTKLFDVATPLLVASDVMRGTDSAALASGVDLTSIHGSALTETPGQLAAAFVKLFDVATPTLVASDVMRGTDSAATAAKLLAYFQSALRSDVTVDADIGGTYDDATDSQQAIRDTAPLGTAMRGTDSAATAAKLLSYFQSALRKDVTVDADIGGTYDDAADSQEAQAEAVAALNDLSAAQVNTEVDNALNTAIPGAPTADSINQRIRSMDLLTEASGAGDLAAILTDTGTSIPALIAALNDPTATVIAAAILALQAEGTGAGVDYSATMATGETVGDLLSSIRAAVVGQLTAPGATTKTYKSVDGTESISQVHAADYTTRAAGTQV